MSEGSTQPLVSRTSIIGGLIGGLVHTGVAVFLWQYFGFDNLWELITIKPLIGMYILLGMFVLGFVPAIAYVGQKFMSPALVVGGLLLLSGIGSWMAGPVRAPSAVPTPFGFYVLLWFGVVALAGLTGGFEYRRKRRATG